MGAELISGQWGPDVTLGGQVHPSLWPGLWPEEPQDLAREMGIFFSTEFPALLSNSLPSPTLSAPTLPHLHPCPRQGFISVAI